MNRTEIKPAFFSNNEIVLKISLVESVIKLLIVLSTIFFIFRYLNENPLKK